jgi:riboflavin kinase / FMN adenylyltransferase
MSTAPNAPAIDGAWLSGADQIEGGQTVLHTFTGTVVTGDQRGRTLGFPTANIDIGDQSQDLRQGVYAVWLVLDGEVLAGVAAYGKPMFDNHHPPLETHIFDFSADIYGREITVYLLEYIREPQIFSGLADLVAAMSDDARQAREILASPRGISRKPTDASFAQMGGQCV